jgi:prepilin-type processing-associated H-X9-DG protein
MLMYKIVGADQKEYGPVSVEQIHEWLASGRVNSQTLVQAEGGTAWMPLADIPELATPLAGGTPPPVMPSAAQEAPVTLGKMSGMAIASLVLGVLGLPTLGLTALIGLILGLIAMGKIRRSQGALRGRELALAGTIISGVFLLMLPVLLVMAGMLLPALAQAKSKAQSIHCISNMKQLALGAMMHANDNKEKLPAAENWCDTIQPYIQNPKVFQCASGDPGKRSHYAYNAQLSGVETAQISAPAETVLFFECDGGWNVSGGPELMLKKPRHRLTFSAAFVDGHVEMMNEQRLKRVRWDP